MSGSDNAGWQLAHLHRRLGFGANPDDLAQSNANGYASTVERLLSSSGPDAADGLAMPDLTPAYFGPTPNADQRAKIQQQTALQGRQLTLWWLDRLAATSKPATEKLTWLWHGLFATSNEKVGSPQLMMQQNQTQRRGASGNFEALAQAMFKDPAMMVWLDSNTNRKGKPNENFSRELMELFTLGIGNYTDLDVREGARAFTGWVVDSAAVNTQLVRAQADYDTKNFLGRTGPFRGEDVVSMLAHEPSSAVHITNRLWSRLAFPVARDHPVIAELAPKYAADLDIATLVRNIVSHPQFVSNDARTGLVKEPVEWVVGVLRALGLSATKMQVGPAPVLTTLDLLGQTPFYPPSVGGWPQNTYWLSTQTSLARQRFAQSASAVADLAWLQSVATPLRADALAARLGIERWSPSTSAALAAARLPASMVTIALTSPEFVLN